MEYYFVNTDAISNDGSSYHDMWIARGIAVSSGPSDYRAKINKINIGDTVLLYVKRVGVVALGTMLDQKAEDVHPPGTVSPNEPVEYHRKVRWTADLRGNPLDYKLVKKLRGQYPLNAVDALKKGRDEILGAIQSLAA